MGKKMDVLESVIVRDPESGKNLKVFMTDKEVQMILSVGINTLLAAGMLSLTSAPPEGPAKDEVIN
jgi:hypothetical protein